MGVWISGWGVEGCFLCDYWLLVVVGFERSWSGV